MYSHCPSVPVAMAGKAAEHSRLPSPFCYFLGQCQKVNKEKPLPKNKNRNELLHPCLKNKI